MVVIDLKIGEFEASYKGQMELYLRYLEKYEVIEGEEKPIGLILCTDKNEEHKDHLNNEYNKINNLFVIWQSIFKKFKRKNLCHQNRQTLWIKQAKVKQQK